MNIFSKILMVLFWAVMTLPVAAEIPPGYSGTLVVLNKSGNDASFIDLETGRIDATLNTGVGPHELVVSSDGRWAVGTDYNDGNSLTVFDIEQRTVARTIDFSDFPRPHGIDFLSGDQAVIVTSESSGQLVVASIHEGQILGALPTTQKGSHMLALSGNGELAFTSNSASDSVSVINLQRGRLQGVFKVPARPEAIAVNSLATEIWVGSNDEGVVSVLSASTGKIEAQWSGFDWPYRILLSADERVAVIPDLGNDNVRFFDAKTKKELGQIDLVGMQPQGIIFHPDDKTLFLSLSGVDKIIAIDADSRTVLGEYETGSSPDGLVYSALK